MRNTKIARNIGVISKMREAYEKYNPKQHILDFIAETLEIHQIIPPYIWNGKYWKYIDVNQLLSLIEVELSASNILIPKNVKAFLAEQLNNLFRAPREYNEFFGVIPDKDLNEFYEQVDAKNIIPVSDKIIYGDGEGFREGHKKFDYNTYYFINDYKDSSGLDELLQILHEWFGENLSTVQKAFARMLLAPRYDHEALLIVLYGKPKIGKTTFAAFMKKVLAPTSHAILPQVIYEKFHRFPLLRYHNLFMLENIEDWEIFKTFTGTATPLIIDKKYGDPLEIEKNFRFVISTTQIPDVSNDIKRRMIVLEMHPPKHIQDNFRTKLLQPKFVSAAFHWLLRVYMKYLNPLDKDVIVEWLKNTNFTKKEYYSEELYADFKKYHEKSGIDMNQKTFTRRLPNILETLNIKYKRKRVAKGYKWIILAG